MHRIDRNHVDTVAPLAVDFLRDRPPEPFFLSVGFFETHRSFFEPSSVRDTLYSLPPAGLPDVKDVRRDMAAFKASARSLDQGVGAVLNGLLSDELAERTLVVCTTDHGLAFPGSKATLTDRGTGVMLIVRGPGGFEGGRVIDALVSQLDLYPTFCALAGVDAPEFVQGESLLPLVRRETDALRRDLFSELTYHAAYEPQRAIRTERHKYIRRYIDGGPVLANCDDSPTKDLLVGLGWGDEPIPRERLFDLAIDPDEANNLAQDPAHAAMGEELAARLDALDGEHGRPAAGRARARPAGSADQPPLRAFRSRGAHRRYGRRAARGVGRRPVAPGESRRAALVPSDAWQGPRPTAVSGTGSVAACT